MTVDEVLNIEHSVVLRYYLYDIELYSAVKRGIDVSKFAKTKDKFIADSLTKKIGYNKMFDDLIRKMFVYIPAIVCKEESIDRMLCIDDISICLTFLNEGRCLNQQFSLEEIIGDIDTKHWDDKEYRDSFKKQLAIKTRKILKDQKAKFSNCNTKEELLELYHDDETFEKLCQQLKKQGCPEPLLEQTAFLKIKNAQVEIISTMCSFISHSVNALPIEFNEEVKNMIDPIKLGMLIAFKSMMEPKNISNYDDHSIDFTKFNVTGVYSYWFYKYLKNNPDIINSYKNSKIVLCDKDMLKEYSLSDFITMFEQYYKENMSSKLMLDPHNNTSNMRYKEFDELFTKSAKEKQARSEIKAAVTDWEIIKNGNLDKNREATKRKIVDYNKKRNKNGAASKSNIDILVDKWEYFDSTNYITTIEGVNRMSGYVGYIYPNGTVSFEQFWSEKDNSVPAIGKAIYVMDITNFLKLSQLSKPEIMEYIKTTKDNSVRRIYHVGDWKLRHQQEIDSRISTKEKDEYLMNFIDMLKEKGNADSYGNIKVTTVDINNCMKTTSGANLVSSKTGEVFDYNLGDLSNNSKVLVKED